MPNNIKRATTVALWALVAIAVVGGLIGVILSALYLLGGGYVPARDAGVFGLLAACVAFGAWAGVVVRLPAAAKVGIAIGAMAASFIAARVLATGTRAAVGRGGPGGAAEDLVTGALALVLSAVVATWLLRVRGGRVGL